MHGQTRPPTRQLDTQLAALSPSIPPASIQLAGRSQGQLAIVSTYYDCCMYVQGCDVNDTIISDPTSETRHSPHTEITAAP